MKIQEKQQITQRQQHGGAAITLLLMMIGLISILGLVELGYLFWIKRETQKIADLAALAGAQQLSQCSSNFNDNAASRNNALIDNQFSGTLTIRCGHWSSATGESAVIPVGAGRELNAVQVEASHPAIPLFGQIPNVPTVRARAIAISTAPISAFSVGSRLLDINSTAPLQGILRLVGLDLSSTEVASFRGLANVAITPRGLLQALGIPVAADISVGDLNALLAARQVSVGQLLNVLADAGAQQSVANVNVGVLRSRLAQLGLSNLTIPLGSAALSPGLFANINAGANANSALDIDLNALNVLTTGLQIANRSHAIAIPSLNLLGVETKVSVVEPPSIAIGPVGTTAYNSQVRLHLDLDTQRIPALGPLLTFLSTRIKLPIFVDVIDGFGRLKSVNCIRTPHTATIDVTSSLANICIGRASVPWNSTRELCSTGIGNEELVRLFGIPVLTHRITLPALASTGQLTLAVGESGTVGPNALALGDTVNQLVNQLLGTLSALFQPQGNSTNTTAKDMAKQYLEATKNNLGRYQPQAVITALRDGNPNTGLPPLGTWTTDFPHCTSYLLFSHCELKPGDVWVGFKESNEIRDASLLGGLFDVLGLTACDGLLSGILAYNTCVQNNLARFLETKPGGLQGGYNPVTGACSSLLCLLLQPLTSALRPVLNGIGQLLSSVLTDVLGINLGRSVVQVHDIQCGNASLVY